MAWWIEETVLALGLVPTALPELARPALRKATRLPDGIRDLGLAGEPNLELLDQLRVDLILVDRRLQAGWIARLQQIAPVLAAAIYTPERCPYALAARETLRLGDRLTVPVSADACLEACEAALERARTSLADRRDRPVFVVRLIDARNVMIHCHGSIFHDVLIRLGLTPAASNSNDWGFLTTGIEALAAVPDARIFYVDPVPKEARRLFAAQSLWSHLPAVRKGLTTAIPELYSWGALPTAKRFAEALAERLPKEAAG